MPAFFKGHSRVGRTKRHALRCTSVATIATAYFRDVIDQSLEQAMRNRIKEHIATSSVTEHLCRRPVLELTFDHRKYPVDMERFFEFSFSFAEALVDLEEKHQPTKPVVSFERELARLENSRPSGEFDLDIDARWM